MGKINQEFTTNSNASIRMVGADEEPDKKLYKEYYKIAYKRIKGIELTKEEEGIVNELINKNIPKLVIKKGNTEVEIDISPKEMLYFADFIQNIVNILYSAGQRSFEQIVNTYNIPNTVSPLDRKLIEDELNKIEKFK